MIGLHVNQREEEVSMGTITIGLDLAKQVFSACVVDAQGHGWHRVREGYKAEGLAIGNRMRGLLAEFGVVIAKGDTALRRERSPVVRMDRPGAGTALQWRTPTIGCDQLRR